MSRSQTTLAEGRRAISRVADAWRVLGSDQRLAALSAVGLFVSMLLPWYSKTNTFVEHDAARASQASLSAFQAFSFVEAAVLLVSAGVLAMLFARAEGREFQLPGGDGMIVAIAGGWAAVLIFYRLLDKPSLQGTQRITATVGVEWGIFIALLLALAMLYVGRRMRAGERGRPPLSRTRERSHDRGRAPDTAETIAGHGDDTAETVAGRGGGERRERPAASREPDGGASTSPVAARPRGARREDSPRPRAGEPPAPRRRPRFPPAPPGSPEQMSFEDPPPRGD